MKTRRLYIAANWKMNMDAASARELLRGVRACAETLLDRVDVGVFPPFPYLHLAQEALSGTAIVTGAQDVFWEAKGAFTGEVSAAMLKDYCSAVIVGHSERRQYFDETDETVNRRTLAALEAGLKPIVCVGETESEREGGQTEAVLSRQVQGGLSGLPSSADLVIAYEPVWAIGTGKSADAPTAVAAISHIRRELAQLAGSETAARIRIQYGGSVTPDNIATFLAEDEIDGALVGGASLKAESFCALLEAAAALA
jgi:triosephosphate isomerase